MKLIKSRTIQHFSLSVTSFALVLACLFISLNAQATTPTMQSTPHICFVWALVGGQLPPECLDEDETPPPDEDDGLDEQVLAQLDMLRQAVTPFYSFDVATAAGWNVALSECVESPMGGMGYHIANMDQLTNGGLLSLLRPEVLLYAPTEDGSMQFVGVEYIIPAPVWTAEEPPMFLGQDLRYNPHQDIWALHVWIAKENPNGIFEDFNPDVNCDYAP